MHQKKRILIVEDDTAHFELISRGFEKDHTIGCEIFRAAQLSEAREIIANLKPDLVICDWKLPDGNGTDLISKDSKGNISIPIVLMTSYGNEAFAVEAIKEGVLDYIVKSPEVFSDMNHIAEKALNDWDLRIEKRKLTDRINKLSKAVEQSKVLVVITDLDGKIEYVNPKFEQRTLYKSEEVIGRKTSILKSGRTSLETYKQLWDTITAGNEWRGEFENRMKNGNFYWESVSISPIKDNFGNITNYLKIGEDISEKKKMEFELKTALEKAEESNKLKSTILSNMNHELRTPLMGILGMTELLCEEITENEHIQMLERIKSSGKRLMSTLNSILDLSELESDPSLLKLIEYPLGDNLSTLIRHFENEAKIRNLSFQLNFEDKNLMIYVYQRFFEQSLLNIIDNAVKYTNKGGITITVSPKIVNNKKFAVINVKDTGIGIEEEKLDIIFDDFRQASEGISRNYEGTGLGLGISKKMLHAMNGSLSVQSKLGEGSTFTIMLPTINSQKEPEDSYMGKYSHSGIDLDETSLFPNSDKPLILSVEDNFINQEVTKLFLDSIAIVEAAKDGKTAVAMAKEKQYDVILMDIHLGPGMDGVQTTKEIRQISGYEKKPIIAVTGYATTSDRERFLSGGLSDIIVKPFNKENILRLVKDNIPKS